MNVSVALRPTLSVEHLLTYLILCGIFYNDFKTSLLTILCITMGITYHTLLS